MEIVQTILITLFTLGVLVTVHEYGHFWVARRCGIKVLRFSVGFGKPLIKWQDSQGTEYVIAGIPLGGYVKMLDEREGAVAASELHRAFNRASPKKRIAVAAAGPLANFALAIFVYWLVFLNGVTGVAPIIAGVAPGSLAEAADLRAGQEIVSVDGELTPTWESLQLRLLERIGESGTLSFSVKDDGSSLLRENSVQLDRWMQSVEEPRPLQELGLTLYMPELLAEIDQVVAGGAADRAGLQAGDKILSVDGSTVANWQSWVSEVRQHPEVQLEVRVERSGQERVMLITPERNVGEDGEAYGFVGVGVKAPEWPESMLRVVDYNIGTALVAAADKTWAMTTFTLESIKKMIMGLLSPKNLSGPITIAKVAGASAEYGFFSWLSFLGLLSISLGVLNLLPIPILDGGHIVYALIESVSGRPVTEQFQIWANQVGLVLVACLMVFALYNDVVRL